MSCCCKTLIALACTIVVFSIAAGIPAYLYWDVIKERMGQEAKAPDIPGKSAEADQPVKNVPTATAGEAKQAENIQPDKKQDGNDKQDKKDAAPTQTVPPVKPEEQKQTDAKDAQQQPPPVVTDQTAHAWGGIGGWCTDKWNKCATWMSGGKPDNTKSALTAGPSGSSPKPVGTGTTAPPSPAAQKPPATQAPKQAGSSPVDPTPNPAGAKTGTGANIVKKVVQAAPPAGAAAQTPPAVPKTAVPAGAASTTPDVPPKKASATAQSAGTKIVETAARLPLAGANPAAGNGTGTPSQGSSGSSDLYEIARQALKYCNDYRRKHYAGYCTVCTFGSEKECKASNCEGKWITHPANLKCEPLVWSQEIAKVCHEWSQEMAKNEEVSHDKVDKRRGGLQEKVSLTHFAENVCMNMDPHDSCGKRAAVQWYDSIGHRKNILYPKHKKCGIGVYQGYHCNSSCKNCGTIFPRTPSQRRLNSLVPCPNCGGKNIKLPDQGEKCYYLTQIFTN